MKKITRILATFAFFLIPFASNGQGRVDIVQIYQNFLASRVAALECHATDKSTDTKFLANQMTVTIRATQSMKERNPNVSDGDLGAKIIAAQNALQKRVKQEVAKNGCSSDLIQQLLKLYKLHSTMSLGG